MFTKTGIKSPGSHIVDIKLTDSLGLKSFYTLNLTIESINLQPYFESFPDKSPGILMFEKNETLYSYTLPQMRDES